MTESALALQAKLREGVETPHSLRLRIGAYSLDIFCSEAALEARLRSYFSSLGEVGDVDDQAGHTRVYAIESEPPQLGHELVDWTRDPGKTGRKDAFADLDGGRHCYKVRTDMQFVLSPGEVVAIGPCQKNDNQVINVINAAYMSLVLREGHVLCHAAAVVPPGQGLEGKGLALAGVSGAGKSTLALRLISDGYGFTSNDRLLVLPKDGRREMAGVPKQPRVNPGTLLNNPDLVRVLPNDRREAVSKMPVSELWELEEKYDVDVAALFGRERIVPVSGLALFGVLTWNYASEDEYAERETTFIESPHLLDAVMKNPGPFHVRGDGTPQPNAMPYDRSRYLEVLGDCPVIEFSGRPDFDRAAARCRALLE